ncbi:hypothetical protein HDU67_007234 [Dinochytrium kinnereticum]|nr:hypothetical protein HDU67_007234 [Dinochytrium kinnereticum]
MADGASTTTTTASPPPIPRDDTIPHHHHDNSNSSSNDTALPPPPRFQMLDPEADAALQLGLVKSNVLRALSPESELQEEEEEEDSTPFHMRLGADGVLFARLCGEPKFSDGDASRLPFGDDNLVLADGEGEEGWLARLGLRGRGFTEGYRLFFRRGGTVDGGNQLGLLYGHPRTESCPCDICCANDADFEDADMPAVLGLRPASDDSDIPHEVKPDETYEEKLGPREASKAGVTINTNNNISAATTTNTNDEEDDSYDDESDDADYVPNEDDDGSEEDTSDDEEWREKEDVALSSKKRERALNSDAMSSDDEGSVDGGSHNRKRLKSLDDDPDLTFPNLDTGFFPRVGEIGWYPTSKLYLNIPDVTYVAFWPVLVVSSGSQSSSDHGSSLKKGDSDEIRVMPLPLPSDSEISYLLSRLTIAPDSPQPFLEEEIDSKVSPGHFLPRRGGPPAFRPRRCWGRYFLPFRLNEVEMTDMRKRRLNRGLIQAVAASASFEVLRVLHEMPKHLSVFPGVPPETYVECIRWGSDVIKVGDVVLLKALEIVPTVDVLMAESECVAASSMEEEEEEDRWKPTYISRVMELQHILQIQNGKIEIEGRLFHLNGRGDAVERCLGVARFLAQRELAGRWVGQGFAHARCFLAIAGVSPRAAGGWWGWVGEDTMFADAVATICKGEEEVQGLGGGEENRDGEEEEDEEEEGEGEGQEEDNGEREEEMRRRIGDDVVVAAATPDQPLFSTTASAGGMEL